jgi:hypothetical protein
MVNFAHLLIPNLNFLLSLSKSLSQIWTFIFFISNQYGALIEKMTMREMFVSMLITGKIIEESLAFLHTQRKCAIIGTQKIS